MMIARCLYLVLALLAFAPVAFADPVEAPVDPKNLALAQDIVKSFDLAGQLHAVLDIMPKMMNPVLDQANPGQSDKIQKIVSATIEKTVMTHVAEMEQNNATIYARLFSADELQQIHDFYQSPVGQKFIKTTPEVMQRSATLNQGVILSAIKDASHAVVDEIKKNGLKVPREMGV